MLRHNVSDAEVEQYTRAYDVYRKSLTSHRIALFPSKLPEVVMNWSRGFSAKFHMHHDTVCRLLVIGGQYYFDSSFARAGPGFDPVKLDMCASLSFTRAMSALSRQCVSAPSRLLVCATHPCPCFLSQAVFFFSRHTTTSAVLFDVCVLALQLQQFDGLPGGHHARRRAAPAVWRQPGPLVAGSGPVELLNSRRDPAARHSRPAAMVCDRRQRHCARAAGCVRWRRFRCRRPRRRPAAGL